jgi:exodeoxyribonuclease-3
MKLYSWNVNGIRAVLNKGSFQDFIKQHDPDILCLQEVKANQDQVELDLPGYIQIWNSATKKGYAGTAIFTKLKPLNSFYNFPEEIAQKYPGLQDNYGDTNTEGRITVAEFEDFFVATVYTPNSKGDLERLNLRHQSWDPAFLDYMKLLEQKKPVFFSGDLNVAHQEIDLARPKDNRTKHGFTDQEREGFSEFVAAGFVDTLRYFKPETPELYTWWTHWGKARERNVGWRIDYWLCSKSLLPKLKDAKIHPEVTGSDHCPVSIEIE